MAGLTVVLCNYNHAHYLPSALDALTQQSVPPDELIVIDDASTDGSREIIAGYAAKFSFIIPIFNRNNLGVIPNANHGLEIASGDYVFFAAADDRVLPGFFRSATQGIDIKPGIISTDPVWFENESGKAWVTPLPLGATEKYFSVDEFVRAQRDRPFSIPGHATFINKHAALAAGGLLADLKWYSDWFMNLVAAYRMGIYYIPAPYSAMRLVEGAYSTGTRVRADQIQVLRRMGDFLTQPKFADVRNPIKRSAVLACFGWPLLIAFSNRKLIRFLTFRILLRIFKQEGRQIVASLLPDKVAFWLRKRTNPRSQHVNIF